MTEVERWSPLKVWLFSLTSRSPQSNIAAVDLLRLGPGDRFLDIGCGLGAALEYGQKAGAATAGIDPSPTMVERARKRVPTAEVELGSAEEIPFPDDRFTAMMAVATFHHWADRDRGLAEVFRVLVPGVACWSWSSISGGAVAMGSAQKAQGMLWPHSEISGSKRPRSAN